MINQASISRYSGKYFTYGSDYIYLPPNPLLQTFISNYTISFPTTDSMPDEYMVLPTASSTLVISVDSNKINYGVRGVNTMPCYVGAYANKMNMLLLIEFHPGGLLPFIHVDQTELVDTSYKLDELDKELMLKLEEKLIKSQSIETLVEALNGVFLERLNVGYSDMGISLIEREILLMHGNINLKELSQSINYSEKQTRRLFTRHIGITPKLFSRIVRTNYALQLIQEKSMDLLSIACKAGFYDQAHFNKDFKVFCGLTPQEYKKKMSFFYNDHFKM